MQRTSLITITLTTLFAAPMAAAAPDTIVWSADVADDDGPLTGTVSLSLLLFDAPVGGTVLHREEVLAAAVIDGALVHELGASADNPLDVTALAGSTPFLEVTLDGEVLSPRLAVRAVPFALSADTCLLAEEAVSLGGLSAADVATDVELSELRLPFSRLDGVPAFLTADNVDDVAAVATDAEVAQSLATFRPAFSSIDGLPPGLADGELTAGAGLVVSGNVMSIAAAGVGSAQLGANAVNATHIGTGVIGADEIAANAVGSDEIATGAVGAAEIGTGVITGTHLAIDSVGVAEIAGNAVGASEIADSSITGTDIAPNTIDAADVDGDTVFEHPAACGGALSRISSCTTQACGSTGGLVLFRSCNGTCNRTQPDTCSNAPSVGELVRF